MTKKCLLPLLLAVASTALTGAHAASANPHLYTIDIAPPAHMLQGDAQAGGHAWSFALDDHDPAADPTFIVTCAVQELGSCGQLYRINGNGKRRIIAGFDDRPRGPFVPIEGDALEVNLMLPRDPVVAPNGDIFFWDGHGLRVLIKKTDRIETLRGSCPFLRIQRGSPRVAVTKQGRIFVSGFDANSDSVKVWELTRHAGKTYPLEDSERGSWWSYKEVAGGGEVEPSSEGGWPAVKSDLGNQSGPMIALRDGSLLLAWSYRSPDQLIQRHKLVRLAPAGGGGGFEVKEVTPTRPYRYSEREGTRLTAERTRITAMALDKDGSVIIAADHHMGDRQGRLFRMDPERLKITDFFVDDEPTHDINWAPATGLAVAPGGGVFVRLFDTPNLILMSSDEELAHLREKIVQAYPGPFNREFDERIAELGEIKLVLKKILTLPRAGRDDFLSHVATTVNYHRTIVERRRESPFDSLPKDLHGYLQHFLRYNDRLTWSKRVEAKQLIRELEAKIKTALTAEKYWRDNGPGQVFL